MKKLSLIFMAMVLCCNFIGTANASKLSKYLHKMDENQRQREAQEWQQDMDFANYAFRLQQRYVDEHGQQCRDYEFRGRSNPYIHGMYTVCNDR